MRSILCALVAFASYASVALAAPVHEAAKTGDTAALAALLDNGVSVNESNGIATPLYYTISKGHFEAAKLLVERGADVNLAAKWGPPLMAAAESGRFEFVKLVLDAGADATIVFKQQTALHIAADKGCLDCVAALVGKGADVNALNYLRQPPVHLAKSKGHQAVAEFLLSHGYTKPAPPPVAPLLASADLVKGEAVFMQSCRKCHSAEADKGSFRGPNLWNIVGRVQAAIGGYKYSPALREAGGTWGFEDLNIFISDPARAMPGMDMDFAGLQDDAERADLIAFLRTRSDNPEPLPK